MDPGCVPDLYFTFWYRNADILYVQHVMTSDIAPGMLMCYEQMFYIKCFNLEHNNVIF